MRYNFSIGLFIFAFLLSSVSCLLYIFYAAGVSPAFYSPRDSDEAAVVLANYPAACHKDDFNRFTVHWFMINAHHLLGIGFVSFPLCFILLVCIKSMLAVAVHVVVASIALGMSIVAFIITETRCSSFKAVSGCDKQCLYKEPNISAPSDIGVSTEFWLLRILVPVMWALLIVHIVLSFFFYRNTLKTISETEKQDTSDEAMAQDERKLSNVLRRRSTRNASEEKPLTEGFDNEVANEESEDEQFNR